jgi:hypothetical protein
MYLFSTIPPIFMEVCKTMSKLTTALTVVGSALSAVPVDFRTPLRFVRDKDLAVNVTVSNSAGVYRSEALLIANSSVYVREPGTLFFDSVDTSEARGVSFDRASPIDSSRPGPWFLGIGALSILTQRFGALAVIKGQTRAELVLSSTLEYFASQCQTGTLLTLDRSVDDHVTPSLGEVDFGIRQVLIDTGRHIFSVPYAMYERVEDSITAAGGRRRDLGPGSFSECTRDALPVLPNITLRFGSGSLVYFPEDYVEFSDTDNICELLIRESPDGRFLTLNPLKISHGNVRVSDEDEWNICDSAATFQISFHCECLYSL